MNILVKKSHNKTFSIKTEKWSWVKYLEVVKIPFDRNESCSRELIPQKALIFYQKMEKLGFAGQSEK
jgi:hypothetical protein